MIVSWREGRSSGVARLQTTTETMSGDSAGRVSGEPCGLVLWLVALFILRPLGLSGY